MDYNPLFDRLWGSDGVHPFGNPYNMDKRLTEDMDYEELETEICEFLKGDFKTTIVCKFNSKGYLVSHTVDCIDISEDRAILITTREELHKALDEERYEDAKLLQEKINKLWKITTIKPTF